MTSLTQKAARAFLAVAQLASALGGAVIGVTQPAALSTLTGSPRQARADVNPAGGNATEISGTVFQDFNSNGVMNTDGITPNLAIDAGVSGVVVSAYLSGSVSAATTASTDASGAYTLTGLTTGAQYRVEFTSLPQGYYPSFYGSSGNTSTPSNGTTVQFAAAGTSNVSLGINQPCDYCQANVQVASAFFRRSNEGAGEEAFTIYPIDGHGLITTTPYYLPTGDPGSGSPAEAFRIDGADQPRNRAYTVTLGALGSVYGVAYGRADRRVFASAYFKRFAPIGPGGLGAIYEIDPDNAASVTEFADLNDVFGAETVGPDMHDFVADPQSDFKTVSGYAITNTWDAAGKTGIGDIDLSDDGASMYVMNLYNRSIYVLPTNAGPLTSPAAAALIQSTAVPTTGLYVPDSPGVCPAQDVRPFGLKYYLGKVYVTVVCSGESRPASGDVPSDLYADGSYKMGTSSFTDGNGDSRFTWQDDKNLHGYVLRMDPATLTFEPTPVISFPLTFREAFGAGQMAESFHSWSVIPRAYVQERYIFPQPMLSDIEFERGNMVLAVRDRMGDQSAAQVYIMEGNGTAGETSYPNGWADARSFGQLLRACGRADTGWTLENNGVCGGVTAAAPSLSWSTSTGPGGRRWYDDQAGDQSLHATSGSLAVFPGVSLISAVYDPAGWTNQGMRWYDNNTGAIKQSYNYYQNIQPDYSGGSAINFGKGVGMGDVELLCDPAPLEVGNRVWQDVNGNGIQDAGEPGIANVTVQLLGADGSTVLNTTSTGSDGLYYFNLSAISATLANISGTQWTVRMDLSDSDLPAGYKVTDQNAGGATSNSEANDLADSDGDNAGAATQSAGYSAVTFTTQGSGTNNHTLDFGVEPIVYDLGNRVWFDTNNDGVLGGGEQPVASVSMQLRDSTGSVIATTTTDANGYYSFTNLYAGAYSVTVAGANFATGGVLAGYWNSTATTAPGNAAGNNNTDHGANPATYAAYIADGVSSGVITLGAGLPTGEDAGVPVTPNGDARNNLTIDFGFYKLEVGNQVWYDTNNNGQIDGGEQPVAGIPVALLDNGGNTLSTTTTNASGFYTFTGLASGAYQVVITAPVGYFSSDANSASALGADNEDDGVTQNGRAITSASFTLAAGSSGTSVATNADGTTRNPAVDFGLYTQQIGNTIWVDVNNNGVIDGVETPYTGGSITVALVDNSSGSVVDSIATSSGLYTFTGVPSGTYVVSITVPAGFQSSTPTTNTAGVDDNDNGSPSGAYIVSAPFAATPGTNSGAIVTNNANGSTVNPSIDFGLYTPIVNLGNQVWFDTNNNGLIDGGEVGVNGVTVALYTAAGNYAGETTTAGDGHYTFTNLAEGGYYVVISPTNFAPGGALFGYTNSTATTLDPNDNTDSDDNGYASGSLVRSGVITLSVGDEPSATTVANDSNWTVDFGFYKLEVGNQVWYDTNNNGQIDGGEQPVAGIPVALLDNGGSTLSTTTTNASGFYTFTGLAAGAYQVVITAPVGYFSSDANSATALGADNEDDGVTQNGRAITSASFTLAAGSSGTSVATNADGATRNPAVDFGLYTQQIGNTIWVDVNNNGVIDNGETPYAGTAITVTLVDNSSGAVVDSIVTSSGLYTFTGVPSGTYVISITTPAGVVSSFPTTNTAGVDDNDNGSPSGAYIVSAPFAATPGTNSGAIVTNNANGSTVNPSIDFGVFAPVVNLGNQVWFDTNNNGLIDGSEVGVNGVTVALYTAAGDYAGETTTANGGWYTFTSLAEGGYYVVISPTNFAPGGVLENYVSSDVTTADPNDNTNGDDNGYVSGNLVRSGVITLTVGDEPDTRTAANDANWSVDFGFYKLSVGNLVWEDVNNNGVYEPGLGETPRGGVSVAIVDANGAVVDTMMTDVSGYYSFTGLISGTYVISVTPPAGYRSSTGQVLTDGSDDNDHGAPSGAAIVSAPFDLTPGAEPDTNNATGHSANPNLDFGLYAPLVNLGNQVWFDTNNNGLIDGGEVGVNGVTVALFTAAGNYAGETTTAGNGWYTFTALAEGGYYVVISPTNFAAGGALFGYNSSDTTVLDPNGNTDNDDNGYASGNLVRSGVITLTVDSEPSTRIAANDSNWTVDFGFYTLSVGDLVWEDSNNNGMVDAGEPPLANVLIAILDGSGTVVSTTLTDASGLYTFGGLISGTYVISITPPAGYLPSGVQETTDGGNNTNHGVASGMAVVSAPFDLTPGAEPVVDTATASTVNPNLDFGLWLPAGLGNYVWRDYNRDGVQNEAPNAGVNGVTVTLYVSTTLGGWAPISSTATANDPLGNPGYYTFTNLVSGTYQVVFDLNTLPAGATVTAQDTLTGTDALDSDADPITGVTAPVTLFPGDVNPTIDMGVIMPAGLGDTVWLDVDYDGQQDAGEPPVQGVTVTLYMSGTPVSTTVTNGSGYYEFVLLTPGVPYSVTFTLPNGYTWTLPTTGDSATDSNVNPVTGATGTVILQPGEFNPTIDAGIWTPPTASVTKTTLNPGTVRPQQQINYQIVVRNTGVTLAQNVVISDPVPAGTSYVAGSASPAATPPNGVIVWPPVNLMPGQAVTVTMSVSVNNELGGVTVITNVAQVDNVRREIELASNLVANPLDPTAITLDALSAQLGERGVTIAWRTTLERETLGFYVLRSLTGSRADALRVNSTLIAAQGANGGSYELLDVNGTAGARYWIEEIELSGASVFYGPVLVATPGLDTGVTQQGPATRLEVRPGGVAIVAAGANAQPVVAGEAGVNGQRVIGGNASVIQPSTLGGEVGVAGVNGQPVLAGVAGVNEQGVSGSDASVAAPNSQPVNAGVVGHSADTNRATTSVANADTNRADANVANADTAHVDASVVSADTNRANASVASANTNRSLPWGALAAGAMLGLSALGAGVFVLRRKKRG